MWKIGELKRKKKKNENKEKMLVSVILNWYKIDTHGREEERQLLNQKGRKGEKSICHNRLKKIYTEEEKITLSEKC